MSTVVLAALPATARGAAFPHPVRRFAGPRSELGDGPCGQ
jgi:hypothetical protein